jgi:hypothetical protein
LIVEANSDPAAQQNFRVAAYLFSGSKIEKQMQVDKPVTRLTALYNDLNT